MKTKTKNGRGIYGHTRDNRWKWMASATAATAAGVTASQGSTITINLTGNYISATGGNHLNADLTGDGHPDLAIANAAYFYTRPSSGYTQIRAFAMVDLNGVHAYALHDGYPYDFMQLGSRTAFYYAVYRTMSLMGSIPLFFKDLHINGGAPTKGSLEVTVSVGANIKLDSLTYTSNTLDRGSNRSVPDQGSSLALLAMGAGGVLAFRRWKTTQKHLVG